MFVTIKEINGKAYLYKMKSNRPAEKKTPRHKQVYIGPLEYVFGVIKQYKEAARGK